MTHKKENFMNDSKFAMNPIEESKSCMIKVIHSGQIELIQPPKFGKVSLTFHEGKLKTVEESKQTRYN